MTPYYNTIAAIAAAQYESLAGIDTEGVYECLSPICCGAYDTEVFTKLFFINWLLDQYQYTGTLPVIDAPCCLNQFVCGTTLTGGTPSGGVGPSPTFTTVTAGDVVITDDLTVGDDTTMTGDLALTGLFSRGGVSQPPYRTGSAALIGGTLVIAAPWVTANTILNATYTQASAAGEANISIGTIIPATSFAINGEGTNTFNWHAVVVP